MTRRELEITDPEEIRYILDHGLVLHLGLSDENMPYVIPMNYGYEFKETGKLVLYLHSSHVGHKLDVMRRNPMASFSIECDVHPFEGRVACQYGMTYKSLFGRGSITFLTDTAHKEHAMQCLMKAQTGRGDFVFDERMLSIVTMVQIEVEEYTGKYRPLPEGLRRE